MVKTFGETAFVLGLTLVVICALTHPMAFMVGVIVAGAPLFIAAGLVALFEHLRWGDGHTSGDATNKRR